MTRGAGRAAAAVLLLTALVFFSNGSSRRLFDAARQIVFPSRVTLQVAPGNVRIKAGSPLGLNARLVGGPANATAQVEMTEGERWRTLDMTQDEDGRFRIRFESVPSDFKYRVLAGSVTSPTYSVTVANAPRVTRIDVDYTYPVTFGNASRRDEDGGDIYAPAGTTVQLHVHTDQLTSVAVLVLANGLRVPLAPEAPDIVTGSLTLASDGSYRVALAGTDGLINNGDTQYFIRLTDDRPPDVRVLRPSSPMRVVAQTDAVDIEAEAQDVRGVEGVDLVLNVRGDEHVMPLAIAPRDRNTIAKARGTLWLHHLDVKAGDLVTYFVRLRETGSSKATARSNLHFFDVAADGEPSTERPHGTTPAVAELIAAQRRIVEATWKLDRRADNAAHLRSEQDIRALSASEADLKARMLRLSANDGEMKAAAAALDEAIAWLDQLKTTAAIQPEMAALAHLLKVRTTR